MSKQKAKTGSVSVAEPEVGSFLDQNWNERLKEARAQRAKNLSEKRKSTRAKRKESKGRLGATLSGAAAVKALFLFAGSAGFALGAVLGVGILIGWGQTEHAAKPSILAFAPAEAATPALSIYPDQTETDDIVSRRQGLTDPVDPEKAASVTHAPVVAPQVEIALVTPDEVPNVSSIVAMAQSPKAVPSPREVDGVAVPSMTEDTTLFADRLLNSLATGPRSLPEVADIAGEYSAQPKAVAKVFIHAPNGVGAARLNSFSSKVSASGVEVAGIGRERFRVSTTHLRYYSAETKAAATVLATDLGVKAHDFSENAVVPGRIELWVAGQPRKRVYSKRSKRSQKTDQDYLAWLHRNAAQR